MSRVAPGIDLDMVLQMAERMKPEHCMLVHQQHNHVWEVGFLAMTTEFAQLTILMLSHALALLDNNGLNDVGVQRS